MGAGASQSTPIAATPTAPPILLNNIRNNNAKKLRNAEQRVHNAEKRLNNIERSHVSNQNSKVKENARKTNLNTKIASELSNYNKLTPEDKKQFIARQAPNVSRALMHFNNLDPAVKKAIIKQQPSLGGRMKIRTYRATKKAHKNRHRHSRHN